MEPKEIREKMLAFAQPRHMASVPSRVDLEYAGVPTAVRTGGSVKITLKAFSALGVLVDKSVERFVDEEQATYLSDVSEGVVDIEALQAKLAPDAGIHLVFGGMARLFENKKGEKENIPALKEAQALGSYIVAKSVLISRGEQLPLIQQPGIGSSQVGIYTEDLAQTG